eukprot:3883999-Pyramimonas_sp.AAC.1
MPDIEDIMPDEREYSLPVREGNSPVREGNSPVGEGKNSPVGEGNSPVREGSTRSWQGRGIRRSGRGIQLQSVQPISGRDAPPGELAELEGFVKEDATMRTVMEEMDLPYMPLELFEFPDEHTPQEWVDLGREAEGMEYTLAYTKYYQVKTDSWEQQLCE